MPFTVVRNEAHTSISAAISADVTAGNAVKVTGAKTVGPTTAAADIAVGVSHHTKTLASGEKISLRLKGDLIPMKSAAAIAAGAVVEVAAAGKVQTKSTGAAFGVAWTAAAGADAEILVIVL